MVIYRYKRILHSNFIIAISNSNYNDNGDTHNEDVES